MIDNTRNEFYVELRDAWPFWLVVDGTEQLITLTTTIIIIIIIIITALGIPREKKNNVTFTFHPSCMFTDWMPFQSKTASKHRKKEQTDSQIRVINTYETWSSTNGLFMNGREYWNCGRHRARIVCNCKRGAVVST